MSALVHPQTFPKLKDMPLYPQEYKSVASRTPKRPELIAQVASRFY
jgi:hypothetical protein